jgi:hypothetical protein
MRFYALWLHDAGMIKSSPQKIIADGTDWRFLDGSTRGEGVRIREDEDSDVDDANLTPLLTALRWPAPRVCACAAAAGCRRTARECLVGVSGPGICEAPVGIANELLRAEGFTEVRYVAVGSGDATEAVGGSQLDFAVNFASSLTARSIAGYRSSSYRHPCRLFCIVGHEGIGHCGPEE